ncbi:MAG: TlpA family protein disulfide reductase [Myxococcales bacterium]|nr:TlpA family protein disulfide reductase [Myxococcales bacterium]
MLRFHGALGLALLTLTACAAAPPAAGGRTDPLEPRAEPEPTTEPFRVLSPKERVPSFRVRSTGDRVFDSSAWVGSQPFVLVFLATWCRVCEMKLPMVTDALAEHPDLPVLVVSLDDAETWDALPRFLARHRLGQPVIRGSAFPRFALSYDPLQTVPVIAVVGKNGYLVDYQVGYSPSHALRLAAALEIARRMPADAPPFLDTPDAEPPGL